MMKEMKYVFLLCLIVILSSCQKSDIMLYQQRAGVYFSTYEYAYSFAEHPGGIRRYCVCRWKLRGVPLITDGNLK